MTDDHHTRLAALFLEAVELEGDEQAAFLQDACRDDPELRRDVERLLEADRARAVLDTPALGSRASEVIRQVAGPDPPVPSRVGRYTILEVIGRGGMGTVYKARQSQPDRDVALKLIRPELMSEAMVQRFRYEGEVLGRLQDPGIAQIFEAGDAGRRPFLAMELVSGLPLLDYARRHDLTVRERSELLVRICLAVQHAHQHGVIHRDLKPGNILVTEDAQPKILDFGVARATDAEARVTMLHTSAGELIGTLAYMSPEQVAGDPGQVDARSDIYAIGVVGFELLTGRLPYDIEGKPITEAAQAIREVEPWWAGAALLEPRGDLRIIIGKALNKDRSRRYQSAAAMADDLERYLRDEPILARPATLVYQFRKFARRNKALVGGSLCAVLLLVLGIAGTSFGLIRARHEAFKSRTVNEFFNEVLSSADPFSETGGQGTTLVEILDRASRKISGAFPDQPHVEAAIRLTLGRTYSSLAHYDQAATHLEEALALNRAYYGHEHESVSECLRVLATNTVHQRGAYKEAEDLLQQALRISTNVHGLESDESVAILRDLAWTLKEAKDFDRAARLYEQALRIQRRIGGAESEMAASILNDLGGIARAEGRLDEAQRLYEESLDLFNRLVGETHPYIGIVEGNLAVVLSEKGDRAGAEERYRAAIASLSRVVGKTHTRVGRLTNNLASLLHDQKKLAEANEAYRRALEIFKVSVGEDHPDYTSTLNNYAMLLWDQGAFAESADAWKRVTAQLARRHGDDYWQVHLTDFYIGEAYVKLGRIDEAERMMVEAHDALTALVGPDDRMTTYTRSHLIDFFKGQGRPAAAARYERDAADVVQHAPDAIGK